jgi:hypothetical protein
MITKEERAYHRKRINGLPTIAYWSCLGGVEVKNIISGIPPTSNYVVCVSGGWAGERHYHTVRVNEYKGSSYITIRGKRLYFRDIIWTGV